MAMCSTSYPGSWLSPLWYLPSEDSPRGAATESTASSTHPERRQVRPESAPRERTAPRIGAEPATTATGTGWRQLGRFILVGGGATVAQLGIFVAFALVLSDQWANGLSWVLSTVGANIVHRGFTFGVHDAEGARRDLLLSTGFSALGLLASWVALAQFTTENTVLALVVLVGVNVVVGAARFLALRWWFTGERETSADTVAPMASAA
ncbi:GtrA family protein [Nakamurella silvestris]|nr:GtrA family protein [Nakamurella silvestris]